MLEEWKPYKKGYANLEISNFGNVRGIWNKKQISVVVINDRQHVNNHHHPIYQLVWTVFNGPIPKGYVVHHKDHNSMNDRLDNLQIMTKSEHTIHHHTGIKQSDECKRKKSEKLKGRVFTEETKMKMSKSAKKRGINIETRQKMALARIGHVVTEETRQKISNSKKGHIVTEETRQKLREKAKGRIPWNKKSK